MVQWFAWLGIGWTLRIRAFGQGVETGWQGRRKLVHGGQ